MHNERCGLDTYFVGTQCTGMQEKKKKKGGEKKRKSTSFIFCLTTHITSLLLFFFFLLFLFTLPCEMRSFFFFFPEACSILVKTAELTFTVS